MAATNYALAQSFQSAFPHTFNGMQKLLMAMADFQNSRGKKSFFGRDKGLIAYKKFEEALRDTLLSMVLDGVIMRNSGATECREQLCMIVKAFSDIFPNWQDAYAFAYEYLVVDFKTAEDRIQNLMQQ